MRPLPWSLPALLLACTLQAQPRSQLPDPVAFPENRWVDLGRPGPDDVAADREALSVRTRERGVWVRVREAAHRGSHAGLFIYDYYFIDCEGRRSRYHMRLYVFDKIVHNSTGMTSEWEPIAPGSVPGRLCELRTRGAHHHETVHARRSREDTPGASGEKWLQATYRSNPGYPKKQHRSSRSTTSRNASSEAASG